MKSTNHNQGANTTMRRDTIEIVRELFRAQDSNDTLAVAQLTSELEHRTGMNAREFINGMRRLMEVK